ncbi:MAG: Ig-like domain repeat protein, partial [Acidobacteriaceae bacterium]
LGAVAVGSAAKPITLGFTFPSGDTLTAVNVLTKGASNKDFTADASTTCKAQAYSAGDTCNVVVDLTPAKPGLRMGAVQLVDSSGAQATVYLQATGTGPLGIFQPGTASVLSTGSLSPALYYPSAVAVDGAGDVYIADQQNFRVVKINQATQALSFTSTGTGDSSAQQTMTVENIGNQPLNFTALNTTTTGLTTSIFDLNGPTTCTDSTSLIAGATCDLGVEFVPTAPGSFNGTADITDNNLNAAGAVQQVQLSGTGTGFAATMVLSEAPSSSVTYGTPVTVTATLSGNNGTPSGNIMYTLDGVVQPSVALSSGGVAQFTLPGTLSVGTHSVLVNYAGDDNYTESTPGSSFNLTVNAVATTTTLAQPSA